MDRLSTPRVGPTDVCEREQRYPRPGQLTLNDHGRRMPGERNARSIPTAANGYSSWSSDDEKDVAVAAIVRSISQ